jgi:dethiobiotin synthetase
MKRYFILGTDTDCGKTYVTRQLIDHYKNAVAIKPVASGYNTINKQLVTDADQLLKNNLSSKDIGLWHFKLPVSPHIAAEKEGKHLNVSELVDYCTSCVFSGADTLFIEGAGGLMVPLNNQQTWVDFLTSSNIPVLLVVGMKLGCINHALLTEAALRSHGIKCVGWIANCIDPKMLVLEENIETLNRLLKAPLLTVIPYQGMITESSSMGL